MPITRGIQVTLHDRGTVGVDATPENAADTLITEHLEHV